MTSTWRINQLTECFCKVACMCALILRHSSYVGIVSSYVFDTRTSLQKTGAWCKKSHHDRSDRTDWG